MSTLDHIGVSVSDFGKAKAFYVRALAPLGIAIVMEVPKSRTDAADSVGFGKAGWTMGLRDSARITIPTTMLRLCSTLLGTTLKRCAILQGNQTGWDDLLRQQLARRAGWRRGRIRPHLKVGGVGRTLTIVARFIPLGGQERS